MEFYVLYVRFFSTPWLLSSIGEIKILYTLLRWRDLECLLSKKLPLF